MVMLSDSLPTSCQLLPTLDDEQSTFAWKKLQETTQKIEPSTWVKLRQPPTAFSFDEAWLLCDCGNGQWLAWVPDYGEILLTVEEFY
jgi:hypothetical protein